MYGGGGGDGGTPTTTSTPTTATTASKQDDDRFIPSRQNLNIELFDMNSRQIKSIKTEGASQIQMGENLQNGFYFYRILDSFGETVSAGKLLKIN